MSLNANALFVVADAAAWLPADPVAEQANLELAINAVSQAVEDYLGRVLRQVTYTHEVYDGPGCRELVLRQWPATDLTALEYRLDRTQWQAYETDEYVIDAASQRIVVLYERRFPDEPMSVRATYKGGYVAGTTPDSILQAGRQLLTRFWRERKQTAGVQSLAMDGQTTTFLIGMTDDLRALLDPHVSRRG